jgi:hypothetical protein
MMVRTAMESEGAAYRIRVAGALDETWSDWFDGLSITTLDNGDTLLSGLVRDQSALHGLLNKIRDMGLILLCLEQYGCSGTLSRKST